MHRTVHLIHGFNEEHPIQKPRISVLAPLIKRRGYDVMIHDYGKLALLETTANDNLARLIYPHVKPGDTLVGFSNGAALIAHLQFMGVETPNIVLIQPALGNHWVPNPYTQRITVFWNSGDVATVAGKWWHNITGVFPWRWKKGARHAWGAMGHTGYVGKDKRYVQYRTNSGQLDLPVVSGHTHWDDDENRVWREIITSCV